MNDFKTLFGGFKTANNFLLADPTLPIAVYYGLDSQNRYSVGIKTSFEVGAIESTKLLSISLAKTSNDWWTTISLNDKGASDPFYAFCDDVISTARNAADEKEAYSKIASRIACWKKMFGTIRNLLAEEAIRGLFGELYFMKKELFPRVGPQKGEEAWSGPLCTDKDFSIGKEWYEIKSVSVNSPVVKITSLEQLDSLDAGHLVLIRNERMAEEYDDGLSDLNELFQVISNDLSAFPSEQKFFFEKLDKLGFAPNEMYKKYKFRVVSLDSYLVDDSFPKLSKRIIGNGAVVKVAYELSILALEPYKEKKDV